MALVVMTSGNPDGHRFHFPREIGNAVPLQIAHSAMVAGWPGGRDIEYLIQWIGSRWSSVPKEMCLHTSSKVDRKPHTLLFHSTTTTHVLNFGN